MFAVLWEYEVRAGAEHAFAALYGADGMWVALFRESPDYLGTELLHDQKTGRFLTIDRWRTEAAYVAFRNHAQARYARIDAQGDALTSSERCIGRYTAC